LLLFSFFLQPLLNGSYVIATIIIILDNSTFYILFQHLPKTTLAKHFCISILGKVLFPLGHNGKEGHEIITLALIPIFAILFLYWKFLSKRKIKG
jgi:hypothetical protein